MNPILQMLNGQNQISKLIGLAQSLKNGNPEMMFNQMMQSNPQFKSFVDANKGKSLEQIAQENGVDLSILKSILK